MNELADRQNLGRAKNAIQEYLIRQLLVPKIYLDAQWDSERVDVLAIDRAGVGDVHTVLIASELPHLVSPAPGNNVTLVSPGGAYLQRLEVVKGLSGHFRYLASIVDGSRSKDYTAASGLSQGALAPDGVGRVGLLFIDLSADTPSVKAVIKAERFRSTPQVLAVADRYVAEHMANWEVRD